jgi:hypothetical protein
MKEETDYGGEKPKLAILEEAAERMREAGYSATLHRRYEQREGVTAAHKVEACLRVWKDLPAGESE